MPGYLIGVQYDPSCLLTDFGYIMSLNPKDCLFIYNENVEQFLAKDDRSPGGGNAVLRKFRLDGSGERSTGSLGIPTMFASFSVSDDPVRFSELIRHIASSLECIRDYLRKNNHVRCIVWSGDENLNLGMVIAVRSKRISEVQMREIQHLVKLEMKSLVDEFQLNCFTYPHKSLSDADFMRILRIA